MSHPGGSQAKEIKKTILLVEDEALIAMHQAQILEDHGYRVLTTHSGEKAISTVETKKIDLVLMDINLGNGKMDGTETAQKILEKHDIPIIFHTSYSDKETVERVKGITGYGYVLKTSGAFVLLESIRMAFELFEAHQRKKESESKYRAAFLTSPDAVNINRLADGLYVDINEGFTHLTGYTEQDVIGRSSMELNIWVHTEDRKKLAEGLRSQGFVDNLEADFRCKDGSVKTAIMSARIVHINGEPHILSVTRDVTEKKKAQEALRLSEERLHTAVEGTMDGLWDWNLQTGEAYHSDRFATMLGYEPDELPYTSDAWSELLHPDDREKAFTAVQEYLDGKSEAYESTFRMKRKDGSYGWVTGRGKVIRDDDGTPLRFIGFNTDVTRQKELEERNLQFQAIFERAHDAIFIETTEDYIVDVNRQACLMMGYGREELIGMRVVDLQAPEVRTRESGILKDELDRHRGNLFEGLNIRKDGKTIPVEISNALIPGLHGDLIVSIVRDVSESKETEHLLTTSIERLQTIMDSIPADIYITDTDTYEILFMNRQMIDSFGRDCTGMACYKAFRQEEEPCSYCPNTVLLNDRDNPEHVEIWETFNPTNNRWYLNYDRLVHWMDGRQVKLQIAVDISERKEQEEWLREALEEKEFLMAELNHRVKNNLLMVSSLISLKDSETEGNYDLSDLKHQIDTIRILHEKLKPEGKITQIDVAGYIHDILSTVFDSFAAGEVQCNEHIEPVSMKTRTAIPLGLLVNEIATNAMKHGFFPNSPAEFSVRFYKDRNTGEYELELGNSGRPFPEDINLENPSSLGLRLVANLVTQIGGTLKLQKTPSPVFTIRFPAEEQ